MLSLHNQIKRKIKELTSEKPKTKKLPKMSSFFITKKKLTKNT
jgi:hypothetical protein